MPVATVSSHQADHDVQPDMRDTADPERQLVADLGASVPVDVFTAEEARARCCAGW